MKRLLIIIILIFSSYIVISYLYRKDKTDEVVEYVSNKFFEQNIDNILSSERMCVISKRDKNFHRFYVYNIYMFEEVFFGINKNPKRSRPYKIDNKKGVYFIYYDNSREKISDNQIPDELLEEVPLPWTLCEEEWQVIIDSTNYDFAVFHYGYINDLAVDTAKLLQYVVSDTASFKLIDDYSIYKL